MLSSQTSTMLTAKTMSRLMRTFTTTYMPIADYMLIENTNAAEFFMEARSMAEDKSQVSATRNLIERHYVGNFSACPRLSQRICACIPYHTLQFAKRGSHCRSTWPPHIPISLSSRTTKANINSEKATISAHGGGTWS